MQQNARSCVLFFLCLLLPCSSLQAPAAAKTTREIWTNSHSHFHANFSGVMMGELWHVESSHSPWKAQEKTHAQEHWVARALSRDAARLHALSRRKAPGAETLQQAPSCVSNDHHVAEDIYAGFARRSSNGGVLISCQSSASTAHTSSFDPRVLPRDHEHMQGIITTSVDDDEHNASNEHASDAQTPSSTDADAHASNQHVHHGSSLEKGVLAAVDVDGPTQNPEGNVTHSPLSLSYFMILGVGNPHKTANMFIDTGSNLMWLSCDHQCENCYNPEESSSHLWLPCSSNYCLPPPGHQDPVCTAEGRCAYHQGYADKSFSDGVMMEEIFFLDNTNIFGVLFGCSSNTQDPAALEVTQMSGGILGLGASFPSLQNQVFKPLFFCLPVRQEDGTVETPGFLGFGDYTNIPSTRVVTPLKHSQVFTGFHYVPLTSMSINGVPVQFTSSDILLQHDGYSGTIIDSGTSITRLFSRAYNDLKSAFSAAATQLVPAAPQFFFDACFTFHSGFDASAIPVVDFHFEGGGTWTLQHYNILLGVGDGIYCFAFLPLLQGQEFNILGNMQLAGTVVVIDPFQSSITIAPNEQCK